MENVVKHLQRVILGIITDIDALCQKNSIDYYLVGGSTIGAVRHKGFIPWDDDIDVAMPREDYDKFMEICPKELDNPYFLQSPLTDKDCYQTWLSLRNSDTTGNRISCMSKRLNNGVAIDILPLEGCEDSLFRYKLR